MQTITKDKRIGLISLLFCGMFCFLIWGGKSASASVIKQTVDNQGDTTTTTIQTYLDQAKEGAGDQYEITVPKGTYLVTSCLRIYSNTTLDITGCTFIIKGHPIDGYMLQVGRPKWESNGEYTLGKYSRGSNITIKGGTFDAGKDVDSIGDMFTFSHVKNMTLDGVTFKAQPSKPAYYHMVECAAVKNIIFKNCKFLGNQKCKSAFQIESARKNVASMNSNGPTDGTKTFNVTIVNCTFSNLEYAFGTNHGTEKESYKGITVKNCVFKKITKYAICAFNYKNALVKGNKTKQCAKKSFAQLILNLGKNSLKLSGNK